jgi:excisionase family DNA binding protein
LLLAQAGSTAHLACMDTHTALSGLAPLIGIEELAQYLDLPVKTLYKWRQEGVGPASVRVGRHVRYFVSDVQDWLLEQRTSTRTEAG